MPASSLYHRPYSLHVNGKSVLVAAFRCFGHVVTAVWETFILKLALKFRNYL